MVAQAKPDLHHRSVGLLVGGHHLGLYPLSL